LYFCVLGFWVWERSRRRCGIGRTLNRHQTPPWWGKDAWTPRGAVAPVAATAPLADPSDKFTPALTPEPAPPEARDAAAE
jgi:hypothetical protein